MGGDRIDDPLASASRYLLEKSDRLGMRCIDGRRVRDITGMDGGRKTVRYSWVYSGDHRRRIGVRHREPGNTAISRRTHTAHMADEK